MQPNPEKTADFVAFTEEILNEKLHFFLQCGSMICMSSSILILPVIIS